MVQQAPHALAALKFPETIDLVVRVGDTGKGMHGVIAHLPILESCGSGKKLNKPGGTIVGSELISAESSMLSWDQS